MIRATFSGFNTALSAIQANQKRLDITGQNLSNMNTTGYTRQALVTSSLNYSGPISQYMTGAGIQVGFGVAMDKVTQIRDPFLDAQYRGQMEKAGYTDSMQTSLDSLAKVLDESSIKGIRQAFDNIQSTLTNLADPAKTNDAVFESELRARMEDLANLLNNSAAQIEKAAGQEFERLDGTGTNENGAMQKVNDILRQIGELNRQIKHNQIFDQPSLELMDQRNVLLDELAGYIPIEVKYQKDANHADDPDWPEDLYVHMNYYQDGLLVDPPLTLISGTEGAGPQNYGQMNINKGADPDHPYLNTTATFTAAPITGQNDVTISSANGAAANKNTFRGGSIQSSLDMLGGAVDTSHTPAGIEADIQVHGYQYYINHLDNLAYSFATIMNEMNKLGNNNAPDAFLLVNKNDGTTAGITASTIGINQKWADGTVTLGKGISADGNNANDTALAMLKAMSLTYPTNQVNDPTNRYQGVDLGNKTFAGYMNNISTILATDSAMNQSNLKTNVTVLNGIQDSRDSLSGVSLDEEAANMMTFMAAYNAASRLMTTMDEALNTLINSTGLVGR
ncbi:MAG: flagellar biosynthesis protein FlgK [Lachnospiraceae bacterium]|jgi:flagellar hook-associated protein 1 FlgK|nr:flagellar biosynthesis protein FlgK [Lachnospiraceae bacterium]